jgi:Xaa-Pro aminopeptidase
MEDYMNNIEKFRAALGDKSCDFDAILITGDINRRYATGFPGTAGVALILPDGAWFFTDTRYFEAAASAITNAEVRQMDREYSYAQLVDDVCAARGIRSLGYEDAVMTVAEYAQWGEHLTASLNPASSLTKRLRAVKSSAEIELMIAAQRVAEQSFNEMLPMISREVTERELAAELTCRMLKNGAEDKSFDPIIVSGTRSSMPHGVPTDAKIGRGFLTIDFGAKLNGWCSDTTRTLCIGEPTDEERRVYDAVLRAQLVGISKFHAGVLGCEVHSAAQASLDEAGYGEYFGHGFGHSLGLEIHEDPNANAANKGELPEGAVVSAEPGVYLPGRFGVRIEDVVVVTRDGCRDITNLPKELQIIDA